MAQNSQIIEIIREKYGEIPVALRIENDYIIVSLKARVSEDQFKKYVEVSRSLGLKFDSVLRAWIAPVRKVENILSNVIGKYYRSYYYIPKSKIKSDVIYKTACYTVEKWKTENGRRRRVEETICLYKEYENDIAVPRGLAKRIAKAHGFNIPQFAELPDFTPHEKLREYQVEVLRNLWSQLQETGTGVVQMATGAGKSYTAGYLAKLLAEAGYHVYLVALQLDLVNQLREFAKQWGAPEDKIHAVTVQTLYRRITGKKIYENGNEDEDDSEIISAYADESDFTQDEFKLFVEGQKIAVIMDEVHHLPAHTVREVMNAAAGGWALRVGLSATPWRNDGKDLEIYAYSGDVIEPRISSSYLIKHGYAVPVEIRVIDVPSCGVDTNAEGAEGYMMVRRQIATCRKRNEFIAQLVAEAEKPVLVLTQLIKHAHDLGKMIKEKVPKTEIVTGAVKGEKRMEIYNKVKRNEIDVLVATTLADEGLDLPPLRTLVIAMGGKSKTRTLQRVGRLVRPWPGKERGIVYELRDNAPFFEDHLEERLRLYKTEPYWKIVNS